MAVNQTSSTLRLMGMSSGMDTDGIIKQMMKLSQAKLDTKFRARTLLEWRQQTLKDIRTDLSGFKSTFLTTLQPNGMFWSSAYNSTVASVSGKNAGAVSVSVTGSFLSAATFRIGQITSLARVSSVSSSRSISSDGKGFALSTTLGKLEAYNKVDFGSGDPDVNINGKTITLGAGDTIDEINHKLKSLGGNEISFNRTDADGRQFAEVKINGKAGVIYKDDAYTKFNDFITNIDPIPEGDTKEFIIDDGTGSYTVELTSNSTLYDIIQQVKQNGGNLDFLGNITITDDDSGQSDIILRDAFFKTGFGQILADSYIAESSGDTVTKVYQTNSAGNLVTDADGSPVKIDYTAPLATGLAGTGLVGGIDFGADGLFKFTINNEDFSFNRGQTIDELLKEVNKRLDGQLTMKYDQAWDRFTLEAKETGDKEIDFSGLGALGLPETAIVRRGSYASVYVDGEYLTDLKSNTFTYRGVQITLNGTTNGSDLTNWDDFNENDITVILKRDATEPLNKIKKFIEGYNAIIKKLEDMLSERKTKSERSYLPLTDEEKSAMTEKQIEAWEEIAKKGLLRSETSLQTVVTKMRRALSDQIVGLGVAPSQIGLATGSFFDGKRGQIVIDEEKLRAALEENPDQVMDIFLYNGTNRSAKTEEKGFAYRLDDIIGEYIRGSSNDINNALTESIRRANEQMDRMQKKLQEQEERLYRKFAAMETALAKMQSQTDWISSMAGGNSQSK